MSTQPQQPADASPTIASVLMYLTYAAGFIGGFIGFKTVSATPPSLSVAAIVAVGFGGGLSFLRHSVFNRSDAVRIGWNTGARNNFQIEVGLANLAWALLAVLAVVFGWGLAAQAASFLAFGFYLLAVAVMLVSSRGSGPLRPWRQVVGMAAFGAVLTVIGVLGMRAV